MFERIFDFSRFVVSVVRFLRWFFLFLFLGTVVRIGKKEHKTGKDDDEKAKTKISRSFDEI